jgi:hypothetical protein
MHGGCIVCGHLDSTDAHRTHNCPSLLQSTAQWEGQWGNRVDRYICGNGYGFPALWIANLTPNLQKINSTLHTLHCC